MIITAAGHRFIELPGQQPTRLLAGQPNTIAVQELVREHLTNHRPDGFFTGAHLGFSLLAAEVAMNMRIPLVVVLPYASYADNWPSPYRDAYLRVMLGASRVHYVARTRRGDPIDRRNRWMVDRADCALVLWDGTSGRINDMVQYAWSRRKNVKNLWRDFLIRRGFSP